MIFLRAIFIGAVVGICAPAYAATFVANQDLSFGTLIPTATSGTVTLSRAGVLTTNNVVTVAPSGTAATPGRAVFTGSGLGAVADVVNTTFLSNTVTLTGDAGGTVTVTNFNITPDLQITVLNPSTTASVGAQMSFTGASNPGKYTGSVQIRGNDTLGGTATVTLPITLTLWRALSVTQTRALNFGWLEVSGGNSVIGIAAASGERSIISGTGVRLVTSHQGASAAFTVTGQPNTNVTVTLPSSITLTGPGAAMTVNNFVANPTTTKLNASGNLTLNVGARLTVGANQAPGTYSGTYNLTVSY